MFLFCCIFWFSGVSLNVMNGSAVFIFLLDFGLYPGTCFFWRWCSSGVWNWKVASSKCPNIGSQSILFAVYFIVERLNICQTINLVSAKQAEGQNLSSLDLCVGHTWHVLYMKQTSHHQFCYTRFQSIWLSFKASDHSSAGCVGSMPFTSMSCIFFPDPILILGIWSVVFFCCFNRTCIWDVLAGSKLDVSKLAVCTFSAEGGQKLCCKKPGANWRLGGNFVGCSNRPVNMVKAKRRGKRVGGTVKMHPNPRDDWSGRNHKWDFCGPSCWDVFLLKGEVPRQEFLDSQVKKWCHIHMQSKGFPHGSKFTDSKWFGRNWSERSYDQAVRVIIFIKSEPAFPKWHSDSYCFLSQSLLPNLTSFNIAIYRRDDTFP